MKIGESFVFDVEKVQPEELAQCRVGDYVNLWIPKDVLKRVYIYRRGSVGGTGKIGYVQDKFSNIIATHLNKGLKYETEIVEINVAKLLCKIKCKLIGPEETAAKQAAEAEEAASRLRIELQKRYTLKNPLSIRVQLPKNHKLKEGQELYLEI